MFYYITPNRIPSRRHLAHRMHEHRWDGEETSYRLPVDVQSDADNYLVRAFMPGIKSEDLDIQIVNDQVTIKGIFQSEKTEGSNFLARELPEGEFSRTFSLPDQLNAAKAEAKLKDGIFTLSIPKAEEAKPKSIRVSIK